MLGHVHVGRVLVTVALLASHYQVAHSQQIPTTLATDELDPEDATTHDTASALELAAAGNVDTRKVEVSAGLTPEERMRRSIIDDIGKGMESIGDAIGGAVDGNSSLLDAVAPVLGGEDSSVFKWAKTLLGGAGDTLGALGGLMQGNLSELTLPALFLGIGVGDGAVEGLNLTTKESADEITRAAVAAAGEGGDSVFNDIAQAIGKGIAAVVIPSVKKGKPSADADNSTSPSPTTTPTTTPSTTPSTAPSTSTSSGLLSKIDFPALAQGAGAGLADGLGTSMQPVLGDAVFPVTVNNTFSDLFGSLAYAFTRGLASEAAGLGLGFLGIGNATVSPSLHMKTTKRALEDKSSPDVPVGGQDVTSWGGLLRRAGSDSQLLQNGTKTGEMVSGIAQSAVDMLTCRGVGGAIGIAGSVAGRMTLSTSDGGEGGGGGDSDGSPSGSPPSSSPPPGNASSGMTLPDIDVGVWSEGNYFSVSLGDMAISVNGVSFNKLIILLAAHIVIMILALLVLFPTALMVESIKGLAILIGRPAPPAKIDLWLNGMQIAVPFVVLVGTILGVVAGGDSVRFRTTHGKLGIALTLLSILSGVLSTVRRLRAARTHRGACPTASTYLPLRTVPVTKSSHTRFVEPAATGLVMILTYVAWTTGIDDLRAISLCLVDQVSMTVAAGVGGLLTGLWYCAVAFAALEFFLARRLNRSSFTGPGPFMERPLGMNAARLTRLDSEKSWKTNRTRTGTIGVVYQKPSPSPLPIQTPISTPGAAQDPAGRWAETSLSYAGNHEAGGDDGRENMASGRNMRRDDERGTATNTLVPNTPMSTPMPYTPLPNTLQMLHTPLPPTPMPMLQELHTPMPITPMPTTPRSPYSPGASEAGAYGAARVSRVQYLRAQHPVTYIHQEQGGPSPAFYRDLTPKRATFDTA